MGRVSLPARAASTRFMLLVVPRAAPRQHRHWRQRQFVERDPDDRTIGDVALTWYIANAQGILLFGGLTVLLLSHKSQPAESAERR